MSYSQYERGKYIQLKMIHLLLLDGGAGKINVEQFGIVWDLIDEIDTAGTTHCHALASNKYYIRAVEDWVRAKKIHRKRIAKSKTF